MKRKALFSAMLVLVVLLFSAVGAFAESVEMTLTPEGTWYYSEYKGSATTNPNYQSCNAGDIIPYTEGNSLTLMKSKESYIYVNFDLEGITLNSLKSAELSVDYDKIMPANGQLIIESISEATYNTSFPLTGTKTLPEPESTVVYQSEVLSSSTTAGVISAGDISEYIKEKIAEGQSGIYLRISYGNSSSSTNGFHFNGVTLDVTKELIYHTVTFVDHDGSVLKTETVEEGQNATAPENPTREDYNFTGWDVDFSNVTSDLKVTAQYEMIVVEPEYVASGTCGENLTWILDKDGTLTISGSGNMYNWTSSSGAPWFSNRWSVKKVVMQSGITGISSNAFYGCRLMTSVIIPDGVRTIGSYAFGNCAKLETVTIPSSVVSIGSDAFHLCDGLKAVYYKNTISRWNEISVGGSGTGFSYSILHFEQADSYTVTVTFVDFDGSVIKTETLTDGDDATAPANPTREGFVFAGWDKDFTNVTTDLTVTAQYDKLVSVDSGTCGDNLTWSLDNSGILTISGNGDMAWTSTSSPWYLKSLSIQKVVIENGVTSIGEEAFEFSENLIDVIIPDSVTSIGDYAFYNCNKLTTITIPDSVTSIGDFAFYDCNKLTAITIPDSVTSIGRSAFKGCYRLTSATIGKGVSTIGYEAFHNCSALTNLIIPNSVISIDNSAFGGCATLTEITIGSGLTTLGDYALDGCAGLVSISVSESNSNYSSSDGVLFDKNKTTLMYYPKSKQGDYEIPDSVTHVAKQAFSKCSELTGVVIPDSITYIDNGAFSGCSKLTDISILGRLEKIGTDVFSASAYYNDSNNWENGCLYIGDHLIEGKNLPNDCTVKEGTVSIMNSAFKYHYFMSSITIPESVKYIGDSAFFNCQMLATVYYGGTREQWNEIQIGMSNEELLEATIYHVDDCIVTFVDRDGNIIETQVVKKGTAAIPPEAPAVEGYTFTGWDKDISNVTSDLTVTAQYEIIPVEPEAADPDIVIGTDGFPRYYIDGEIQTKWQVTPIGYKYYFSTSAAKYGAATIGKGIKISGIYYDFDTDGRLIESYDEDGNPVYYCDPSQGVIYTVTYDGNGGTASVESKRRRISTVADLTPTAEKENCKFLGWGLTKFATEPITGCTVTGDMTLYAVYEQTYVVMCEDGYYRYYVDGVAQTGWRTTPDGYRYYFSGTSTKYGAAMVGKNVKIGSSYYDFSEDGKLIDSYDNEGNPVYAKYFNGFISDSNGNTKYYKDNKYLIDWQYIDGYKYYFSKSTGNMLTGYTRVGSVYYNFNQDGTWNGYFQKPLTPEECLHSDLLTEEYGKYRYYVNGEFYTGWKVLKGDTGYYKYYFSKSDGRAMTAYGVKVGSEYLDFSPTGTLINVFLDESGNAVMEDFILSFEQGAKNGVILDEDGFYRYYIDGEYQTGWQTVDGYQYLFKSKDGSAITSLNYKYGAYYYDFAEDGKLLAKKKAPDTRFIITLTPGEGATGSAIVTGVVSNTEYKLPENTFTKENYRFIGWTDGTEIFQPGKIILANSDKQFTAVWEYALKIFTMTFTYGEESTVIFVTEGEELTFPENTFAREGYMFDCWTDGQKSYASGEKILPAENMEFTPLWKVIPNDVTLTFRDRDHEDFVLNLKEGHVIGLTGDIFERDDCRFIGWLDDIYIYLPGDIITVNEDMVLTAVWQKVTEVRVPIEAEFIQPANNGTSVQSVFTGEKPYISVFDEDNDFDCTKYYLNPNARIIINGYDAGLLSENTETYYGGLLNATDLGLIYAPNQGEAVLVDKNGDSKYDVLEVTAYETTIVDEVYGKNTKIATKFSGSIVLTNAINGEEGYSYTLAKNGQAINVSDLKEYDVLSVAVSPDKKNYKILVSDTKVEGTVVSLYKPSMMHVDNYVWTIKGTEYKISNFTGRDTTYAHLVKNIIPGDEGIAYIDVFGKIAYFEKTASYTYKRGFLVEAGILQGTETNYELQIMDSNETFEFFQLADYVDVTVGATAYYMLEKDAVWSNYILPKALYANNFPAASWVFDTSTDYYDAEGQNVYAAGSEDISVLTDNYANRIVSYKLDENDKIVEITFPQRNEYGCPEDGLFKYGTLSSSAYISEYSLERKMFANAISVNAATKVYMLPITASATTDNFYVTTIDVLTDARKYDVSFLQVDQETYTAGIIVVTNHPVDIGTDDSLAVVTKVMTAKDADGYDIVQITFLQNGEEKTLYTTPELYESAKGITKGSLFEYSLNGNGCIDGIDFANLGNGAYPLPTTGYIAEFGTEPSAYTDETGYAEGFVVVKDASRRIQIKSEATLVSDVQNGTNSVASRHAIADYANVYVIDLTKSTIKPVFGAYGDIQTTYADPNGHISDTDRDTYVLIKYVKGVATDVVVYKGFAKVNNILQ